MKSHSVAAVAGVTAAAALMATILFPPAAALAQTGKKQNRKSGPVKTRDGRAGGRTGTPDGAEPGKLREWSFTAGDGAVVPASNDFAFRLLAQLSREKAESDNIFFSPVGLSLALGMTANGAAGETQAAIAKTLGWGASVPVEQANKDAQSLTRKLAKATPGARLAIANAIWAGTGEEFTAGFVRAVSRSYDATAGTVDFGTTTGIDTVNRWFSDMTGGKINKMLSADEVGSDTPFVLTNAVYFKGKWNVPFSEKLTRPGDFNLLSDEKKTVPMMARTGFCPYVRGEGFQAVSLPYDDGKLSMYVFLPDENRPLAEFQAGITPVLWDDWLAQMKPTDVALQLPKFTLTFDAKLNNALQTMGMASAFSRKDADFTPMMNANNMYLTLVKHRTTLAVDEQGTEASAATLIGGDKDFKKTSPIPFIVNRPFLCAIRDNETGAIVFLGRVVNPQ